MKNRDFFPLFIDLMGRDCLVVGAGNIALKKVKKLLEYNAKIEVIAPNILEEFYNLDITIKKREFKIDDIEKRFLVIAGTDNPILNEQIVDEAERQGILVNNVTSKEKMNARFSAIVKGEDFQIAISANGNPKRAVELKEKIRYYIK